MPAAVESYRTKWLAAGAAFRDLKMKPPGWDLANQLRQVGAVPISKGVFSVMFERELESARQRAIRAFGVLLPPHRTVELHGAGCSGELLPLPDAVEHLFISSELFWQIIEIGLKEVHQDTCIYFVRASGQEPVCWSEVWACDKAGPFKQIDATRIPGLWS